MSKVPKEKKQLCNRWLDKYSKHIIDQPRLDHFKRFCVKYGKEYLKNEFGQYVVILRDGSIVRVTTYNDSDPCCGIVKNIKPSRKLEQWCDFT